MTSFPRRFFVLLSLCLILRALDARAQDTTESVPIIFDSDMGPDYDDVGAIALLHALADSGEVEILATLASNRYPNIARVFDVFNTYFGRPDVPIGVPKGASVQMKDPQGWTDAVVSKYPHDVGPNDALPSSVDVYRRVLSEQPDNSVIIVTVGFLTNLAELLESGPDEHSDLDGRQLVEQKVRRLVSMAGTFPKGTEFNLVLDMPASNYVFSNWPTEIVFSGYSIGSKIKTGIPLINNDDISESPVKDAYSISIPQSEEDKNGRSSWDQTAVLVAARGVEPYYECKEGRINVEWRYWDAANIWDESGSGHCYLVEDKSVAYMQGLIDELMQHVPMEM